VDDGKSTLIGRLLYFALRRADNVHWQAVEVYHHHDRGRSR
jgi:sulfate adenylyltransferase subunit 1 (EFTu-like GTPase family)